MLDQRVASGRGLFRSATARGWGGTDQGLSVLHATWTLVKYTHLSASSTPPLCSTAGPWPMAPEPLGVKTRTGSETPHEVSPLPTGMQRRRPSPPRADKHRADPGLPLCQRRVARCGHRELRFPPRTYFSHKQLGPARSRLQENAVPDQQVRSRSWFAQCDGSGHTPYHHAPSDHLLTQPQSEVVDACTVMWRIIAGNGIGALTSAACANSSPPNIVPWHRTRDCV